jgi:hypothetical protein
MANGHELALTVGQYDGMAVVFGEDFEIPEDGVVYVALCCICGEWKPKDGIKMDDDIGEDACADCRAKGAL